MKNLVISRKGFDSTAGGCASPIFANGDIFSVPIPQKKKSPNKFSKWPTWFNNPSQFQNLELALARKGFNSDEVSQIIGKNWLNLFSKFF